MLPVVPIAIAAFGGVSGLRLLMRRRRIAAEDVERHWAAPFPGDHVTDKVVAMDGRTALVATDWGAGLLCHGGAEACRIDDTEVDQVPGGLTIRFRDGITAPITVALPSGDAAAWTDRIEGR